MPAGRKTLFKKEMLKEAEYLASLGLTMEEIADFWGVTPRTLYRWQNSNPEFCHTIKKGKLKADTRVIESLYKRATGYEFKERFFKFKPGVGDEEGSRILEKEVVKQVPPDPTAIIFWLKNRRPEYWRDVYNVRHGGVVTHELREKIKDYFNEYGEEGIDAFFTKLDSKPTVAESGIRRSDKKPDN